MLTRLMDLVVLVAELSQKRDASFRELDAELLSRGYSAEEIEQAVFWFTSRGEASDAATVPAHVSGSVRVLSDFERVSVGSESWGFLLRLYNLGIIGLEHFERIIARCIPVGPEKIHLSDVKAIASAVVFNREVGDVEEDVFDQFGEDGVAT